MNQLFYDDNLHVLRGHIADESVDLIYLDPPFNSKRDYNLLFKSPKGQKSEAQIEAFKDTWTWGEQAERELAELLDQKRSIPVKKMIVALMELLGRNDMTAYLVMMTNRLLEMERVLKKTGSVYLHCDDTACHYLRLAMDAVFGPQFYGNQIVWRRTESHNDAKRYGRVTDVILFYTKSDNPTWNTPRGKHSEKQLARYRTDKDGRLYRGENLTASRHPQRRNRQALARAQSFRQRQPLEASPRSSGEDAARRTHPPHRRWASPTGWLENLSG